MDIQNYLHAFIFYDSIIQLLLLIFVLYLFLIL